jgi:RHS repeat-associated protein
VNEPISNATVAGKAAILDSGTNFTGYANVSSGINTVQVQVSDFNGNTVAHYYSVVLSNGTSQTLTYDLNGNLITMTNTTTGTAISNVWDAANRLVAIYSNGTHASLFTYDGLGRRVRQTEISGSTTNSDNGMLWCGNELCEKRDSTGGIVSNRFFAQGEQITSGKYYFTRDHLGSIREMTGPTGVVVARYAYDPWGRRTKVNGLLNADFGFTGHYYHAPSGLDLTLYRAYSADLGRWLNRDPIDNAETIQGPSLYEYVEDNPVDLIDPLGEDATIWTPGPGRSWTDGPRNGNWGGKNWSGGLAPGEQGPPAPPTDSGDACYMAHDNCYDNAHSKSDIKKCDAALKACLRACLKK